jgi:hypothetical protein
VSRKVSPDSADGQSLNRDEGNPVLSRERDNGIGPQSFSRDSVEKLRRLASQKDFTNDAMEASAKGCIGSANYIGKVLRRERPMSFEFFCGLPLEVRLAFYAEELEAAGVMVVRPLRGEEAIRQFAAAIIGLVTEQALSFRMAKASLPAGVSVDRRRRA